MGGLEIARVTRTLMRCSPGNLTAGYLELMRGVEQAAQQVEAVAVPGRGTWADAGGKGVRAQRAAGSEVRIGRAGRRGVAERSQT